MGAFDEKKQLSKISCKCTFKKSCDGAVRTVEKDNFAEAIRWCMDLCIQYVRFRVN